MGFGPPSKITAPGAPQINSAARRRAAISRAAAATVAARTLLATVLLAAFALSASSLAGCSDTPSPTAAVPARSGDKLAPGVAYSADLDGDATLEQILIDGTPASLTITDGDIVYHSREKWRVVEACLGDTDRDGLTEVVTLLDGDDGRHLGLFAYFGGEYRERLVTQELSPRPLALEVVVDWAGTTGTTTAGGPTDASTGPGDVVVLTEEPLPGQTGVQTTIYRWNGFGFTVVGSSDSP